MKPDSQAPMRLGRPKSAGPESHAAIMDAVYTLLQEKSARDLTIEAIAKRAGVGKPTLYKWWNSKASIILAMFHERMETKIELPTGIAIEAALRLKVKHLASDFNGLFGRVMAELIAEAQSDPLVLKALYENHIAIRRAATAADIERGKAAGEFTTDTDAELVIDAIFGPFFYRLMLGLGPFTAEYADRLVDQTLRGFRVSDVT